MLRGEAIDLRDHSTSAERRNQGATRLLSTLRGRATALFRADDFAHGRKPAEGRIPYRHHFSPLLSVERKAEAHD
jgi:hypothetical protein